MLKSMRRGGDGNMTWLESLLYGLLSGIAEFLPISADAHRHLFCLLTGKQNHPLIQKFHFCVYTHEN